MILLLGSRGRRLLPICGCKLRPRNRRIRLVPRWHLHFNVPDHLTGSRAGERKEGCIERTCPRSTSVLRLGRAQGIADPRIQQAANEP